MPGSKEPHATKENTIVHVVKGPTMESSTASFAPMEGSSQEHPSRTAETTAPIVEVAPKMEAGPPARTSSGRRLTRIEGMEALEQDAPVKKIDTNNLVTAEELSFYSASENEHGDDNIWGLLSGVGGNIYEW